MTGEPGIQAAMEAAIDAEVKATTKEDVLAAQAAQEAIASQAPEGAMDTALSLSGTAPAKHRHSEGTWSSPGYRSARTRAKWAQALFALTALAGVWVVVVGLNGVVLASRALDGDIPTQLELTSFVRDAQGAESTYLLCAVGLAAVFLAWLSRTVEIAPALGAGTPKDSPRWAIGWWFIPFAFLWKPYTVVREVWDRLAVPARATGGTLVVAWWLAWIGATFLGRLANAIVNVMENAAPSWEGVQSGFWVSLGAAALSIAAAVLGFAVVREIQARADVRAGALGFDPLPAALPSAQPQPFAPGSAAAPPVAPIHSALAAPATGDPMVPGAASGDLTEALRHLSRLREQGLVTEAEYAAKRTEILARL